MHGAMANLVEDHRTIERVLGALHHTAHELLADKPVDLGVVRQSIAFLEGFLEHCHYPKEEEYLFPAVRATFRGSPAHEVEKVVADHERTRRHFGRTKEAITRAEAGSRDDRWKAAVALTHYWTTLSSHLYEEERHFYPLAEGLLDPEELNILMVGFNKLEAGMDGRPQLHDVYRVVAEDVAEALETDEEALALAGY